VGYVAAFLLSPERSRIESGSGEVPGEHPPLAREGGKPWRNLFAWLGRPEASQTRLSNQGVVVKIAHKPRLTRSELGIHLISVNGNSSATATFRKCCRKSLFSRCLHDFGSWFRAWAPGDW